ncbi:hypothetical protein PRUPE_3G084400 [Prunus persica]|uniref:Uncharacterized protein n=1 Tax=Prunus persica TaxID=3760 RepID=A0A251PXA4_PRUPE|nr:hypothetical protein PRUPE_3G084400 [Prunus persica]
MDIECHSSIFLIKCLQRACEIEKVLLSLIFLSLKSLPIQKKKKDFLFKPHTSLTSPHVLSSPQLLI